MSKSPAKVRGAARAHRPDSVTIHYDLFDLPTAQHKAGLAGLLLQIQSMVDRKRPEATYPEATLSPTTATIKFTESAAQGLFDDLYDAKVVEVLSKSKWPGQAPKREEQVDVIGDDGAVTKGKRFVYDVIQPRGHFLRQHFPDGDGAWLKLWRDMLWSIPRGNPQSRIPFEQRAAQEHCREGASAWSDLIKVDSARVVNRFHTTEVAGSLWIGAQATNAEAVPFQGRAEQNLLLHFWPLTALIFVPQQIDFSGDGEFVGYVLAVPEVANLEDFVEEYPELLNNLRADMRGYRPAESVIDLPDQGALEFLERLARLSQQKAVRKFSGSVDSVEFLHLAKFGNNIKSLANGRVDPSPMLLERYEAIAGRVGGQPRFRNPLFRRGLIAALLRRKQWYEPLAPLLSKYPWPFFVRSGESPHKLPWFWHDAATYFDDEKQNHNSQLEVHRHMAATPATATASSPRTPLPVLIHRIVQTFVLRKTEEKSGRKWDDFKDKKIKDETTGRERVAVPDEYREAKEKIASGVFLELRSRRDDAFVNHFTATFASVKQFLNPDEYQLVANALLSEPENVKTLTLLALSANS